MLRLSFVLAVAACGARAGRAPVETSGDPVRASATLTAPVALPSIVRDPAAITRCGKLVTHLAGDADLLAGRLKLRIPAAARELPRGYDVMSSPAPSEQESRVLVGGGDSAGTAPGDDTLAILAQETWQLDPDRVRAEPDAPVRPGPLDDEAAKFLRALTHDNELAVERVRIAAPAIRVYAGRPGAVAVRNRANAALVLALLVALPDDTLQAISFWISPGLVGEAGCTGFAERIASTLVLGPRRLARGGVRTLRRLSPEEALAITLPEDYVAVHQPGPDFDIYRLFRLRPLGLYPGSVAISIDRYPDQSVPPGARNETGVLLGRPVTWHTVRGPDGGSMSAIQQLAPVTPGDAPFLQVSIVATRQARFLDEFRRVAESLAVTKR